LTGCIALYVEGLSERQRIISIDDFFQSERGYVSYWAMKETGTYGAVDFNHGRNPWRVTDWRLRRKLAEVLAEAA
jgi:hypothetical protein